ncbi:hypothetical protein B0H14DRAFT_3431431 [Mycena olivaceomarginata]|nr:hypothetical protein B0H14DRAFT_3431431 [Mycena olivaceomarginata]
MALDAHLNPNDDPDVHLHHVQDIDVDPPAIEPTPMRADAQRAQGYNESAQDDHSAAGDKLKPIRPAEEKGKSRQIVPALICTRASHPLDRYRAALALFAVIRQGCVRPTCHLLDRAFALDCCLLDSAPYTLFITLPPALRDTSSSRRFSTYANGSATPFPLDTVTPTYAGIRRLPFLSFLRSIGTPHLFGCPPPSRGKAPPTVGYRPPTGGSAIPSPLGSLGACIRPALLYPAPPVHAFLLLPSVLRLPDGSVYLIRPMSPTPLRNLFLLCGPQLSAVLYTLRLCMSPTPLRNLFLLCGPQLSAVLYTLRLCARHPDRPPPVNYSDSTRAALVPSAHRAAVGTRTNYTSYNVVSIDPSPFLTFSFSLDCITQTLSFSLSCIESALLD